MKYFEKLSIFATAFIVVIAIQSAQPSAIEVKRGPPIHSLVPTPRRRSDPELAKWNNEIENYMDDEYEGADTGIEYIHSNAGFHGVPQTQANVRFPQSAIRQENLAEITGLWLRPIFGHLQRKLPAKEFA